MMQTLPFVVAQTSAVKSAMDSELSKQPKAKGASFNQVLSQQMAQEDAKKIPSKANDKSVEQDAEKHSIEGIMGDAVSDVRAKDDSVDAQLLALEVTAKTLEEVTEGKVILDIEPTEAAPPANDVQLTLANVAPVAVPAVQIPIVQVNNVTDSKVENEMPDLLNRKVLGDVTERATANTKANTDVVQQKVSSASDKHQLENDQFVQTMIAESKIKSGQEVSTSKATVGAIETSTIATVSLQPAAKLAATPILSGSGNQINAYPGKAGWNEAVSQKVVWMVGATEQSAKLTLNPPELGPLEVIIHVNNEKADATFISENPEVRKALEEGVSTLRHLMGQAGVELGQANVSTSKQQQEFQQSNREQLMRQQANNTSNQPEEIKTIKPQTLRETNSLVDIFA